MQFRRLAFALALLAAIGALVWFARRGDGASGAGVTAPASRSGAAPERAPATELERAAEDSTRVAEQPRAQAVEPRGSTRPAISAESTESADGSGLLVRVLDPDAKPLPGATLFYVTRGTGPFSVRSPHPTDESGSERLHAGAGRTFDIRASDPQGRYGPAYAFSVPSEQRTLDLVLARTTPHTLLVVDEQGNPVETFAWRMLDERQYRSPRTGLLPYDDFHRACDTMLGDEGAGAYFPEPTQRERHSAGRVGLVVASLAFVVQVDAEDFAPGQAGPFAAEGAPSEIRLVLQHLPGIRGRVVSEGKPVRGAWVKLLRPALQGHQWIVNGFPSRVNIFPEASATTADDGTFTLRLRTSGVYLVQAGARDRCEAELAPRDYSAQSGAEGLELDLPLPGAIEGRILYAEGENSRIAFIGASRGDGRPCTAKVGTDGMFRFDRLTPGPWVLKPRSEELDPDSPNSYSPDALDWNSPQPQEYVVRPGTKTEVEIDLRAKVELAGEVHLAGWEHATGTARLWPAGITFSRGGSTSVKGSTLFQVGLDQPGDCQLSITLERPESGETLWLTERLHLDLGENRWKAEDPVGELVLVNTLEEQASAFLSCDLAQGRQCGLSVKLGPHEERKVSGLPLGTWKRVHQKDGETIEDARVEVGSAAPARLEWN